MSKMTEKVFWNKEVVGVVTSPRVDNFDYYGNWIPTENRELYDRFIEAVEKDGGAQIIVGELDSPLVGTVELEPDEEIEIKIRV
ncbi:MAG: hypothetical protein AAFN77_14210 [Planctomycetota bacterium]